MTHTITETKLIDGCAVVTRALADLASFAKGLRGELPLADAETAMSDVEMHIDQIAAKLTAARDLLRGELVVIENGGTRPGDCVLRFDDNDFAVYFDGAVRGSWWCRSAAEGALRLEQLHAETRARRAVHAATRDARATS